MNYSGIGQHKWMKFAIQHGHPTILRLVLKLGVDVTASDEHYTQKRNDRTALHYAASGERSYRSSTWDILVKDYPFSLAYPPWTGNKSPPENLLRKGDKRQFARHEIVRILIAHGADLEARSRYGQTPLHEAVLLNRLVTTKILLDSGANVNAKAGGETTLHLATRRGSLALCRVLLKAGVDVNAKISYHGTALVLAVKRGCLDLVQLYLDYGADVNVYSGPTSIVLVALLEAFHSENDPALDARLAILALLFDHGHNINASYKEAPPMQGDDGYQPLLHFVVRFHQPAKFIRYLLARGADPNIRDGQDRTALQLAQAYAEQNAKPSLMECIEELEKHTKYVKETTADVLVS